MKTTIQEVRYAVATDQGKVNVNFDLRLNKIAVSMIPRGQKYPEIQVLDLDGMAATKGYAQNLAKLFVANLTDEAKIDSTT